MRRSASPIALLILLAPLMVAAGATSRAASPPPTRRSNAGQLNVVTVNAAQARILDKKSFERLFELARTLRLRPTAFDGGEALAVAVPDVILLQEMRFSNLEIFKRLLKQRLPHMYEIVGADDATANLLANLDTVTPTGAGGTWSDVCLPARTYQWVGLTENATGAPLTAVSVHFSNEYADDECLARNIDAMRAELTSAVGAIVVGGDFNKRATDVVYECDPDEQSAQLGWYTRMTSASETGSGYEDAVVASQRRLGRSLLDQWTFERKTSNQGCRDVFSVKRSRIDYLFVSGATVAEASADHPGWSGGSPGTRHPTNFRYSDHRFVAARIVLNSLPRPAAPSAVASAGGLIQLTWDAIPDAAGYAVLRALGSGPYTRLASVVAPGVTYDDVSARHGGRYRYSIAALAPSGQGWESPPAPATADARGPIVVAVNPRRGATGVARATDIEVRYDESVAPTSVTQKSIRLTTGGNMIRAAIVQVAPRVLRLDPARPLRRGTTYRVEVAAVVDSLGNRGRGAAWKFTTRSN